MDLLTTNQAAHELGILPGTLRRQLQLGKIHASKPGRDWLFTREEVERYRLEHSGRKGPAPAAQKSITPAPEAPPATDFQA